MPDSDLPSTPAPEGIEDNGPITEDSTTGVIEEDTEATADNSNLALPDASETSRSQSS